MAMPIVPNRTVMFFRNVTGELLTISCGAARVHIKIRISTALLTDPE